ncbi:hypothetical protein LK08_03095 [Streptomyces sp. MUSC 125]|nr:hypothetical protein LK08_03095 [Streptomyces sp. MUSC 125]
MHIGDPRGRHRQALAGVAVRLQSAAHDTGDTFDQSAAKGFIDIYSLSSKIAARRQPAARA